MTQSIRRLSNLSKVTNRLVKWFSKIESIGQIIGEQKEFNCVRIEFRAL